MVDNQLKKGLIQLKKKKKRKDFYTTKKAAKKCFLLCSQ